MSAREILSKTEKIQESERTRKVGRQEVAQQMSTASALFYVPRELPIDIKQGRYMTYQELCTKLKNKHWQ